MSALLALPRRLVWTVVLLVVFVRELVVANARVAWEVVTPGLGLRAGIVKVPTDCRTDWEMFWLANFLTMTPGTLSLEVDTDTRDLYVHTLYVTDRDDFVAEVRAIEHVILRALR